MSADPFTAASPTFIAASRLGSKPLPLAAGEVMEFRPTARFSLVSLIQLAVLALAAFTLFAFIGSLS